MNNKKIIFGIRLLSLMVLVFLWGCGNNATKTTQQTSTDIGASEENLYATTEYLTTIKPARNHKNIKSLNKAAAYIEGKFTKYGYVPTRQNYFVNDLEYMNIIASYGPKEAPRFVVGAHYDVFGDLPGADDNASGVAGLLELARLIRIKKPELNYRIDFVAFSLEEPPYFRTENMGSYVHAKWVNDNKIDLLGMASLEMIGFYTDAPNSQSYPIDPMKLLYPSIGNFIAVVGDMNSSDLVRHFKKKLDVTSLSAESLTAPSTIHGVDFSDHMNYWKFNYKALMVTDTSFFRNNNYHKITDTIDTLDFKKMAQVVNGFYLALIGLRN